MLYAETTAVNKNSAGSYTISIKPLASLSGAFDCAAEPNLSAYALFGSPKISAISDAPRPGSRIIILIQETVVEKNLSGRQPLRFEVPNGDIAFFPKEKRDVRPAIFEVTGFDDPKVTETIENLRKLRGKQREEAEKAKAEPKPAAERAAEKKSQSQNSAVK